MERKLSITVIASRPSAELGIDAAWDEPVLPPIGRTAGQGTEEAPKAARDSAQSPRDDASAE